MKSLIDIFSSDLFSYDSTRRRFISEASSLNIKSFSSNMIALESSRTKNIQTFRLIETRRSSEGEIESWQFTISATDAGLDPSLKGITLVILND